jgi:hypothetical protein
MNAWTRVVLVAVVLVGVPLGVFLVARSETPARHLSAIALAAISMGRTLERESYFHVKCGWTGYPNGGPATITCSGRRDDGSGASIKILTRTVNNRPVG